MAYNIITNSQLHYTWYAYRHNLIYTDGDNGESFVPLSCENHPPASAQATTEMATQDNNGNSASPTGAIVGSIVGCAIVATALALLISLATAIYKHKKKLHSHDIIRFNNNHAQIYGKLAKYIYL